MFKNSIFWLFFIISSIFSVIFLYFYIFKFNNKKLPINPNLKTKFNETCKMIVYYFISTLFFFLFIIINFAISSTSFSDYSAIFDSIMLLIFPYIINTSFNLMIPKNELSVELKKCITFETLILVSIVGKMYELNAIFSISLSIIIGYCTSLDSLLNNVPLKQLIPNVTSIIKGVKSTILTIIIFILFVFLNFNYSTQIVAIIYGCSIGELFILFLLFKKKKLEKKIYHKIE